MSSLPKKIKQVLNEEIYKRENKNEVDDVLKRLDVKVSETFFEFFNTYSGPFWEEAVPFELLDVIEENRNIEYYTNICREEYGFPKNFLVLSEMSTGSVLILDSVSDKVYQVNFEGQDELLIKGEVKERWANFYEFLKEYFQC
jgi:hypothetical protein